VNDLPYSKGFLELAAAEPVAFACTTQQYGIIQKIRSDVELIFSEGTPVQRIYIFSAESIRVSDRHAVIGWALTEHNVRLEILDGQAIAELLSDHEIFWIAQEYLHMPAGIMPDFSSPKAVVYSPPSVEAASGEISFRNTPRRRAIRQADSELARAIDLLAAYQDKSVQEMSPLDFKMAFAADLRALHRLAGSPSLEILSQKCGYAQSKIGDYLSGRHRVLSRIQLNAIVSAIAAYAHENDMHIPAEQLNVVVWERKWRVTRKSGMQKIVKNKAMGKKPVVPN
jgi:hypothetical protein